LSPGKIGRHLDEAPDVTRMRELGDIKGKRSIDAAENGASSAGTSAEKLKPYSDPAVRPKYEKGQVDKVWNNAKDVDRSVFDPNTGELLQWDTSNPRAGQWDMGHIPGKEYRKSHEDYLDGKTSLDDFLNEYRDPKNYRPESPSANRGHRHEEP